MERNRNRTKKRGNTAADRRKWIGTAQELGSRIALLSDESPAELEDVTEFGRDRAHRTAKDRRVMLTGIMATRGFIAGVEVVPGCGDQPDSSHTVATGEVEGRGNMRLTNPDENEVLFDVVDLAQNAIFVQ